MNEPIRGKVARVLNTREIAINIGTANGVTVGMCFDVMDAKGQNIKDPDTGKVLGSIERPKVRVQVTYVNGRLSVATTYRTKGITIGDLEKLRNYRKIGPFARSLMPPEWVARYETGDYTEILGPPDILSEKNSYVKVGDPVVQVPETEEADNDK